MDLRFARDFATTPVMNIRDAEPDDAERAGAAPNAARRRMRAWAALSAIVYAALAGLFGWAFHIRYWLWRDCFNDLGRCYDPENGVMLEQAGPIWGGLTLLCALLALRSLRRWLARAAA